MESVHFKLALSLSCLMVLTTQISNAQTDLNTEAPNGRSSHYPIDNMFLERWSPRAMSGAEISDHDLMTLFEAARWAPSSYNRQPWCFVYAKKNTPEWNILFNLLADINKAWAKNASALVVISADNTKGRTYAYDTGTAWGYLALQGSLMDLVVHGMCGFDVDDMKKAVGLPEQFEVIAMCAVGYPGDKNELPARMQEMEKPSGRKTLKEFVFKGTYNK